MNRQQGPPDVEDDGASDVGPADLERSSFGRNLGHMLASQLATWSLALALTIIQPRYLGPEAVGQIRLAFSLWIMASVVISLGTSQFIVLEVARHQRRGLNLLGTVIAMRVQVWVIAAGVFGIYLAATDADRDLVLLMALYGAFVLIGTVSDAIASTFVGLERMSVPATANVVARVVGTVVAIIVLLMGGDAVSVVTVAVGANLIALAILYRAVRRVTSIVIRGWSKHAQAVVRSSSGFLVAVTILTVYQQIDTVVIAVLVDDEVLGWYSTADQLFSTMLFPITILMGAVFPALGRLHSEDPDGLIALVRRSFRTLLIIAVPIGLGTTIVAQQFAPILLGEEFRETGDVLAVLGPVIILTFGSILFGTLAMATERQRFWNTVMFVGVIMTIPLDLVLVPWADDNFSNGAIGGALAYVGTELMMVIVGLWKVAPFLVEQSTVSRGARTAVAGGLMVAAAWPLRDQFLLLPIAVGATVYIVAIFALRVISDDEKAMLGTVLAKVGLKTSWSTIDDEPAP